MAWETREYGRRYFYHCQRTSDGRVVKKYFGNSLLAEVESMRLELRKATRALVARERLQMAQAEALVRQLKDTTFELVFCALFVAGYHNPGSRGWRRYHMVDAIPLDHEQPPASVGEPGTYSPERFTELVKAARQGDRTVIPELRAVLMAHPELRQCDGDLAARCTLHWVNVIAGDNLHLRECLLQEVRSLKLRLLAEGTGSTIERSIVDLFCVSWLQLYCLEAQEALVAPPTLAIAAFRLKKTEKLVRTHLKSLEMLAKVRELLSAAGSVRATKEIEAETVNPEVELQGLDLPSTRNRLAAAFGRREKPVPQN